MTAVAPGPRATAADVLDDLLAALADVPEHLRRLRPSPWADWIASVRGEHAAMRDRIRDDEEEEA